jgi:integral membrane protein
LISFKLLKYLGFALFSAGILTAVKAEAPSDRTRGSHLWTTAGFLICWIAGYGMMKSVQASMAAPWLSLSVLMSLVAFGAAGWCASIEVFRREMGALALTCLVATVLMMTLREQWASAAWLLPLVAIAGRWWTKPVELGADLEEVAGSTREWFYRLARLEGLSLLALFGVYMPFKYALGINLDQGQGWFGWVHGMLQLAYGAALVVTTKTCGWSWSRFAAGLVASLLPFGTFVFERRVRRAG